MEAPHESRHHLDEESSLSEKDPGLRTTAFLLVFGAAALIFVNRGVNGFIHFGAGRVAGYIIYVTLAIVLLMGIMLLRSHDKISTLKGLNALMVVFALIGVAVATTGNIFPAILFPIFAFQAAYKAKDRVRRIS